MGKVVGLMCMGLSHSVVASHRRGKRAAPKYKVINGSELAVPEHVYSQVGSGTRFSFRPHSTEIGNAPRSMVNEYGERVPLDENDKRMKNAYYCARGTFSYTSPDGSRQPVTAAVAIKNDGKQVLELTTEDGNVISIPGCEILPELREELIREGGEIRSMPVRRDFEQRHGALKFVQRFVKDDKIYEYTHRLEAIPKLGHKNKRALHSFGATKLGTRPNDYGSDGPKELIQTRYAKITKKVNALRGRKGTKIIRKGA